jgi:hypothetical protein
VSARYRATRWTARRSLRHPPARKHQPRRPYLDAARDLDERIAEMVEAAHAIRAELDEERVERWWAELAELAIEEPEDCAQAAVDRYEEADDFDGWDDDWSDYDWHDPLPSVVRSWLDGSLPAPSAVW